MDVGVAYGCVDGEVSQRLDERTDEWMNECNSMHHIGYKLHNVCVFTTWVGSFIETGYYISIYALRPNDEIRNNVFIWKCSRNQYEHTLNMAKLRCSRETNVKHILYEASNICWNMKGNARILLTQRTVLLKDVTTMWRHLFPVKVDI